MTTEDTTNWKRLSVESRLSELLERIKALEEQANRSHVHLQTISGYTTGEEWLRPASQPAPKKDGK